MSSIQHDVAHTKRHDRYKATMSLGYSGKDVPSLENDGDEVILTFMKVLERDHLSTDKETRVTDFALLCQFFTLDAISKLGFGKAIGHLELNTDRFGYIKAIETMLPIIRQQRRGSCYMTRSSVAGVRKRGKSHGYAFNCLVFAFCLE